MKGPPKNSKAINPYTIYLSLVNPAAGRLGEKAIDSLDIADTQKNVIVVGGGPAGCMAALVAANRGHGRIPRLSGKRVSIVTERENVVSGMGFTSRNYLMKRFYRANVRVCPNLKIKAITDQGIIIEKAGYEFLLDADTVIVSVGARPRKSQENALKEKLNEIYRVGDCDKIGNAMKSIESAYDTAMQI